MSTKIHILISLITSSLLSAHNTTINESLRIYDTIDLEAISQSTNLNKLHIQRIINFLKQEQKKHLATWTHSYSILPEFINRLNLKTGCEIGVAFGTHSEHILQNSGVETLYSVDPYRYFPTGYDDGMNLDQSYFDILHIFSKERLSRFGKRSSMIRKTSQEAAEEFTCNQLDFIYIDANHSYEAVKQDLESWYDKVRPGGLIAGDDYDHPNFPGTKQAIDEFFADKGLPINQHETIKLFFWVIKPLN
jgi:hypothetical protein